MVSGWTSGRSLPYKHLLSAPLPPPGGAVSVHKWQPVLLLLLFVSSDYCRIPKTKEYIVHRSTVVSTYWIWSGLYVSSSENMEVRLSGVLIIDYNRPLIKALKQHDNRSWTEMFNRLLRGKLVCCLLNGPQLSIDGPFTVRFVPSHERNETWTDHAYNSLSWFVRVCYVKLYLKCVLLWLPGGWKIKVFCFDHDHNRWSIGWVSPIISDAGDNFKRL